jgi:hypothetical protein
MDFAKKLVLMLIVAMSCLTGIVTAADRMVIGEMITSTT